MVRLSRRMEINVMANPLYHRIYEVVRHIPHGRVATYGQVALVVGPPVSAQQVGEAMAALRDSHPDPPVPWQRVINAQGKVSTGKRQQQLLEQEGIVFNAKSAPPPPPLCLARPEARLGRSPRFFFARRHGNRRATARPFLIGRRLA